MITEIGFQLSKYNEYVRFKDTRARKVFMTISLSIVLVTIISFLSAEKELRWDGGFAYYAALIFIVFIGAFFLWVANGIKWYFAESHYKSMIRIIKQAICKTSERGTEMKFFSLSAKPNNSIHWLAVSNQSIYFVDFRENIGLKLPTSNITNYSFSTDAIGAKTSGNISANRFGLTAAKVNLNTTYSYVYKLDIFTDIPNHNYYCFKFYNETEAKSAYGMLQSITTPIAGS